jgi:hypothetical protein
MAIMGKRPLLFGEQATHFCGYDAVAEIHDKTHEQIPQHCSFIFDGRKCSGFSSNALYFIT